MARVGLWMVGGLAVMMASVALIGWLLPVAHVASRSAVLDAPPAAVFETIVDVEKFPAWWDDVSRVEMLAAEDGRRRFRQHTSSGPIVMEEIERTPPSRFVTRIADPDQPFGGTWTWDVAPDGSGSRLTITERGEIYNPIFRFMARFVFGYTATMDGCLEALRSKLSGR